MHSLLALTAALFFGTTARATEFCLSPYTGEQPPSCSCPGLDVKDARAENGGIKIFTSNTSSAHEFSVAESALKDNSHVTATDLAARIRWGRVLQVCCAYDPQHPTTCLDLSARTKPEWELLGGPLTHAASIHVDVGTAGAHVHH